MDMSAEQLALLAIAIFAGMAALNFFYSYRSIRNTMRFKPERIRRLVGGTECARAVAESVLRDIVEKFPNEVSASRKARKLTDSLEYEIEKARTYYLGRVESVHKSLFNDAVDQIIFDKKN